jgi:Tol biopolymer transport system component
VTNDEGLTNLIHTIDANGENEAFLVEGFDPTWSPDGTQLAYVSGSGIVGSGAVGGIFVINADGTNATLRLSHDFAAPPPGTGTPGQRYRVIFPSWSPDGSSIAFTRENLVDGRDTYVMSATGSSVPSLAVEGGSGAAWSPDSTRLAYVRGAFLASITLGVSGETIHATNFPSIISKPAWSADGRSIIFSAAAGNFTRIFIVRDGLPPVQLIPEAFSPPSPYADLDPARSWAD